MKWAWSILFFVTTSFAATVSVEVSLGEFFDKVSILEIKQKKMVNVHALKHVNDELLLLTNKIIPDWLTNKQLTALLVELKEVNVQIWDVEDALRVRESKRLFDEEFVTLARSVYRLNDKRSAIKRQINSILSSKIYEEKFHTVSLNYSL